MKAEIRAGSLRGSVVLIDALYPSVEVVVVVEFLSRIMASEKLVKVRSSKVGWFEA